MARTRLRILLRLSELLLLLSSLSSESAWPPSLSSPTGPSARTRTPNEDDEAEAEGPVQAEGAEVELSSLPSLLRLGPNRPPPGVLSMLSRDPEPSSPRHERRRCLRLVSVMRLHERSRVRRWMSFLPRLMNSSLFSSPMWWL